MIKRFSATLLLCLTAVSISAQNIYNMSDFSSSDLIGTARYVGMGGAMNALGANLSTMGTNPAGIALYRSSDIATTLSINSQDNTVICVGKDKTHVSFDQLGFVYALTTDNDACNFLNFGFNYNKKRNFNTLISSSNSFPKQEWKNSPSQTWQMYDIAEFWNKHELEKENPDHSTPKKYWTPLCNLGWQNYLIGKNSVFNASQHNHNEARWGGVESYNMSLGLNFTDRWYLGLGVNIDHLRYGTRSEYTESLVNVNLQNAGRYVLINEDETTGNGVGFNLGLIFRPVEDSPFRIGASCTTPTYFDLRKRTCASLTKFTKDDLKDTDASIDCVNEYKFRTPWKFNLSMGTIIDRQLAIDAEYEYTDPSSSRVSYGDYAYGPYEYSDDDIELNHEADKYLKGVHSLKVGAEWCMVPNFFIRGGYNFISSPTRSNAFYNQFINSSSLDFATTSSYMNVSSINRFTVGFGVVLDRFYIDLAVQTQNQHGDFYAFNTQGKDYDSKPNECPATRINLNRTSGIFTIGFKF